MSCSKRGFSLNLTTLVLFPLYASAASPWKVDDGSTLTATSHYASVTSQDNPLWASGLNSHLITAPNLRFMTTADVTSVAVVTGRAILDLNYAALSVQGFGAQAITAKNSTVNMTGGGISTAGANGVGISASQQSDIHMKDVGISLGGSASTGVLLQQSTLTAEALEIASSAAGAEGMSLSSGAEASLGTVKISLTNDVSSYGLLINSSTVEGRGVDILTMSKRLAAILLNGEKGVKSLLTLKDSRVESVSTGILSMSGDMMLENVDVHSHGDYSYAIDVNGNSSANLRGGSYLTEGERAHAVWMAADDTTLDAEGAHFETAGEGASAIRIRLGSGRLKDSTLVTHGDNAHAFYTNGEASGENLDISTSGQGAYGVIAFGPTTLTLSQSRLQTVGESGVGLYAINGATIDAEGLAVSTAGDSAHTLSVREGALNIRNSELVSTGEDAAGLYAVGYPGNLKSDVTLDNVTLSSEAASGIFTAGSQLNLTLSNHTRVFGGNGKALWAATITNTADPANPVTYNTSVAVTATDHVALLGNVVTDSYKNRIDLSLADHSVLSGAAQNVTRLTLDGTSRWLMSGDSSVRTLEQNGHVVFGREGGFKTLTVDGDLSGSGQFTLNTQLGDDASPSDRLIVSGDAQGRHGVVVSNKGGTGAPTQAGIPLIRVAGDARSADFVQKNSVVAGNYEYFLNRVSENDWYLQASYVPLTPDTPPPADEKTYRPETAGYLIGPWLNANYGFTSAGTYHERLGAYQTGQAAWGRTYGRHDRYGAGRFGYDVNTAFVQLGGDLAHAALADNWQVRAGPMMTLGRQHSFNRDDARRTRAGLSAGTGKNATTAAGVGGYATVRNEDGTYLDMVGQITRYSNHFKSVTYARQNSYGVVLSAEAGRPFSLGGAFRLEPELQVQGQYLNISQTRAGGVKLQDRNLFTGQGRGGLRLFYDHDTVQPYVQADVIRLLGGTPGIKMNDELLKPDLKKGRWQAGAGVSGKVNASLSLYGEAKYTHGFGRGTEGYIGNLGVRYQF